MAHVEKRGPTRWLAVYKDPDGKRRARSFTRKLDADRFIASQTVDMLRGDWVDPTAGRVTFGRYAHQWLDGHAVRDSTRTRYKGYLQHMRELDMVPLGQLRPSMMREWQVALWGRLAPSTAGTIRGVAATILKAAVLDRLIAVSPLDGVKRGPKPVRQLIQPLPREHVFALRDLITPRLAAAVTLGAGTGLRRGEAMGLTVDRVDFLRRIVTVDRQLVGASDGRPVFGPPKTPASVRQVPISRTVVDALSAHLAEFGAGPDGLIFTAARGGPLLRAKMGAAWRDAETRRWANETGRPLGRGGFRIPAAAQAAYDEAHPDGPGTRFHDLRHFYASVLIAAGLSVKTVQARLGHENASETLDTYAHMWPDDEDRTRAAIDAMFNDGDGTASSQGRVFRKAVAHGDVRVEA